MSCERVQRAISARMDGEPPDGAVDVESHVAGCDRCRAFAETAARTRAAVRIREADRVPDLVGVIMARLETLPTARPAARDEGTPGAPTADRGRRVGRWRRVLPVAAALVVGAVVGSVIVGGPFRGRDHDAVSAEAVVRGVRGASPSIRAFDATYAIVERGFRPDVPLRRLEMRVAFLAPQRFRLDVRDVTDYPPGRFVPTDATMVERAATVSITEPTGCPPDVPGAGCPPVRTTVSTGGSHTLADLVVPMATFGSSAGLRVTSTVPEGDPPVVRVSSSFARAAPMFPFLDVGGPDAWRPIFPGDRVDVLLDATSWMPVRLTVFPVDTEARRAWELRFGLPPEHADTPILDVHATSVSDAAPPPAHFEIPGAPPTLAVDQVAAAVGFDPAVPAETGDLELTSATAPDRGGPWSILVFADGLDYLRVSEHARVSGRMLGCATDGALVATAVGSGSYVPADVHHGRCLGIVGEETTVVLESNLPKVELVEVAGSLPLATGGPA